MGKDKLFERIQADLADIADADKLLPAGGWAEANDNISEDDEGITLNGEDLRLLIRAALETNGIKAETLCKLAKVHSGIVSRFLKGGPAETMSVASARALTAAIQRLNDRNELLALRPETVERLRSIVGAMVFECNVSEIIERALGLFFAALGECPDMLPGYDPRKDPNNKKARDKTVKGREVADEIAQKQAEARVEIEKLERLLEAKREKQNQIHSVSQRISTQTRKAQDGLATLKYFLDEEEALKQAWAEREVAKKAAAEKATAEDSQGTGENPKPKWPKKVRGIRTQRGEYCLIRDKMKYIKRGRHAIYLPPLSESEKTETEKGNEG